jgi:radical SAM superfamily enzyme YgiQ (UPF0313 family)
MHSRRRPAYRAPEDLAQDIRNIARFSRGPVFILGDIRQAGDDYADRFLRAIHGFQGPVILELFREADRAFIQRVADAMPNWTLEISLESHSDEVRKAFGRRFRTGPTEDTMRYALEAGVKRLDIFFMIGLPKQDYQSVMDTVDYCKYLMTAGPLPRPRKPRLPESRALRLPVLRSHPRGAPPGAGTTQLEICSKL